VNWDPTDAVELSDVEQAARWQRIKAILGDALQLPEAAQQAFVERHAADPHELLELQALRAADRADHALLDGGTAAFVKEAIGAERADPWTGREVGGYRLASLIARGGMGQVYRAQRMVGTAEPVAVKFMRDGFMPPSLAQRFLAERQMLAKLDHPNLARLLDGGIADGVPYFVMELVDGEPIDLYCTRHALSVAQRIALFCTLCDVVQHAHQRGVVHRDLKCGNVLVTERGVVKLVDFGIAKNLQQLPAAGEHTVTAERVMTLGCASPEQVRGQVITPSSDVYALGVLLYQLLTDRSPYRLSTAGDDLDLRKAICEITPVPPSQIMGGPQARSLGRELDAVVMKALQKEPARRYASARELSDDLHRHEQGVPVMARWQWVHRGLAMARQRRVLVASLAVLTLAAAVGLSLVHHAREEAARQAQLARETLAKQHGLFQASLDSLARNSPSLGGEDDGPAIAARVLSLLEVHQAEMAGWRAQGVEDVAFAEALGRARLDVAQWQGGPDGVHRGDADAAVQTLATAVAELDLALQRHPPPQAERALRLLRAQARAAWARLLGVQGRADEAAATARLSWADVRLLDPAGSTHPGDRRLMAIVQLHLAQALPIDGSDASMAEVLLASMKPLQALHVEQPEDAGVTQALAAARVRSAQHQMAADAPDNRLGADPVEALRQAVALLMGLKPSQQLQPGVALDLVLAQQHLSEALMRQGAVPEALRHGVQARDGARSMWRSHAAWPSVKRQFAQLSAWLSPLLLASGDHIGAAQAAADAVSSFEPAVSTASRRTSDALQQAQARHAWGKALFASAPVSPRTRDEPMPKEWAAGCEQFRLSLQLQEAWTPRWPGDTLAPDGAQLLEMRQVLKTCPAR
jgi:hypothetical protein